MADGQAVERPGVEGQLRKPPDGRPGWQVIHGPDGLSAWYRPPDGDKQMDAQIPFQFSGPLRENPVRWLRCPVTLHPGDAVIVTNCT